MGNVNPESTFYKKRITHFENNNLQETSPSFIAKKPEGGEMKQLFCYFISLKFIPVMEVRLIVFLWPLLTTLLINKVD
ncbi:MAG: hypothetical protein COA76_14700 [Moritella sp.]|nr:adenosine deaminase [Moritella sp. PE36]PHR86615.1 MAG: hypothetical protein COA76_14700 [Moritella sp.]